MSIVYEHVAIECVILGVVMGCRECYAPAIRVVGRGDTVCHTVIEEYIVRRHRQHDTCEALVFDPVIVDGVVIVLFEGVESYALITLNHGVVADCISISAIQIYADSVVRNGVAYGDVLVSAEFDGASACSDNGVFSDYVE